MFAIVYNLVRLVMLEAGRRQGVPLDRISFVDALRWLSSSPPGTPLPELVVNPHRPGRVEPRCQKRRAKKYPYMISQKRPAATPFRSTGSGLTSCHSGDDHVLRGEPVAVQDEVLMDEVLQALR